MPTKQAPNLGFELDELEQTVDRYRDQAPATPATKPPPKRKATQAATRPRKPRKPRTAAKKPSAPPTPGSPPSSPRQGRPRTLPESRACSFRLTDAQYRWLLTESANRTLDTGKRHDASMLVRELIDRARGAL